MGSVGDVLVSFRYNLTQTPDYESDESSEVIVTVDALQPGVGGNDYVARVAGNGNGGSPTTTGWQQFQTILGSMGVGNHTITIGGYNNKKTFANEST